VPPVRSLARSAWPVVRPAPNLARFVCVVLFAWLSVGFAVAPAAAARGHWQRPVTGPVTRAFDYAGEPFAAGRHRGADFAARTGAPVRSACAGRVVFAGTAGSNGRAVSVRCGPWRVAYLPLRMLAVHRGARVARGALLGTAAGSGRHAGLHVGVRPEGSRWGYVDPLPFFGTAGQLPLTPAPGPLRRPPSSRPAEVPRPNPLHRPAEVPRSDPLGRPVDVPRSSPLRRPVVMPRPGPLRGPVAVPRSDPLRRPVEIARRNPLHRPAEVPRSDPLARPVDVPRPNPLHRPVVVPPPAVLRRPAEVLPWPAWAGLTLVLAGTCGAGLARRRRASRARPRAAVARVARE
jgi:hypothetical protein